MAGLKGNCVKFGFAVLDVCCKISAICCIAKVSKLAVSATPLMKHTGIVQSLMCRHQYSMYQESEDGTLYSALQVEVPSCCDYCGNLHSPPTNLQSTVQ